ncbi:MAG: glycosyl transferase [Bacteroidaceae bacterium]|nr:glycosyl transferase [Bacteroidaceae bacterium]
MQNQIPKIIHYCWFGGNPLPDMAKKCIASWRKFLPDYEIKEWNEQNFDVNMSLYTAEAYRLKKYAYVSDYARFWILYHYGGIYFDTDVEVIRPIDDIVARGSFMGFECQPGLPTDNSHGDMASGLGMGVPKGHPFFAQMINHYNQIHYVKWNGKAPGTVIYHTSKYLDYENKKVLDGGIESVSGLLIYPPEFFCPYNYFKKEMNITKNTRTIHHYMASWRKTQSRWKKLWLRIRYIYVRIVCTIQHKA